MKYPFLVASHPLAAWSCLVPPSTHETVHDVSWRHDGHPPNTNGERLVFLVTLWHVCSLWQPDLFKCQHLIGHPPPAPVLAPTLTYCCPPSRVLQATDSNGNSPRDFVQAPQVPPLVECSAATWPTHPMHASVLTSSNNEPEVWLCGDNIGEHLEDPDAALTHAYVEYVQDAWGGGSGRGESSEHVPAWVPKADRYYGPLTESWGVAYGNASTVVAVRMDRAMMGSAFLEGCWHGPAAGSNSGGPDASEYRRQARARDGRTLKQPAQGGVAYAQDPHEAHGVGMIVKALVQQNAGALLFLRTMVCLAALLCLAYSILVLGERTYFVERLKS